MNDVKFRLGAHSEPPYCNRAGQDLIDELSRKVRELEQTLEAQRAELEAVRDYLDRCIIHWRAHRDEPTDAMQPFAHYYVDALQSVRTSIFGETLPATSRADPGATSGEEDSDD